MRPPRELTYRIERLPAGPGGARVPGRARASSTPHAAYSTFNMGAGFARLLRGRRSGAAVVEHAEALGCAALVAGRVEEGPRRVLLEPVGVSFEGDELELSA